ncbi:MAG TPA: hypothetical protein VMZ53_30485 [Kofleriaceae bacterium]|nr:hypothetical protein [Kofleriaceae bacterium]
MICRLAILTVLLAGATAHAEPSWHAGLNIRGDLGTHPIRIGGGLQLGRVDAILVVDPMFWTDGQVDTDLLAFWAPCSRAWGLLGGWRTSTISILGGTEFQEKLIVGVGAPLPQMGHHIRARFHFELATVVVKHGAGLPADWISFATGRDFIDLVNFGMFVSFEYANHL